MDESSFSGFLSLVEHRLGIGYLWHAEDAWAPNVHDVDPLSFACKKEMVGICYTLPFLLIFHNCSFMERTYFQQVFTCHGIYLECILAVFSQVRTSSIKRLQSESDIKVTDTAQLIHCDSLDWTGGGDLDKVVEWQTILRSGQAPSIILSITCLSYSLLILIE